MSLTHQIRRALCLAGLSFAVFTLAGCDRIKAALKDEAVQEAGDPVWKADSTMLASNPGLVFRILDSENGRVAAPIATIGAQGFRQVRMGPRGWRALDLQYLHEENTLTAIRDGRPAGDLKMRRGMWSAGAQLDSIEGCRVLVPVGVVDNPPPSVRLAIAGPRPTLKAVAPLSAGELQEALSTIHTLISPSSGISTSLLSSYQREVYVLNTGAGPRPSILVIYNDNVPVSDTLSPIAQRPRHFAVILDKGIYGYKTTFTFTTLGNAKDQPRMRWLDYVDVDGDGKAELFFSFLYGKDYEATQVLKFENEAWREVLKQGVRCQG